MDRESLLNEMKAAPPELLGALPRKVQPNSSADSKFLVVGVLLFFIGGLIIFAWLGYDTVKQFQQRAVLRIDSQVVVGQVTGFSISRFAPTGVQYKFTVNGATYSGKASEPTAGTSLDRADKIPIRFLPSNPAVNHPDAWEWSADIGWLYSALDIFLTAMGSFAFAVLWRDRRLARDGKAATGVVTKCIPDDRTFDLEYQFFTEDGLLVTGKTDSPDEYCAGARVWILYLPKRPRRNSMYPLSFFDIV